ncbi:MAG TPA: cob(I)yrinic acid a,c-diamide adenosyltransferase [Acetobacteraceae bacterium]|nr:cob(I)yrinic acid a,c-diamide adenosyltransferase [Acetobacteraceae bacterium]
MTVRIDRVVTRGGDGGETSLGNGERVRKDALRIEALGAVDEANAALGLLRHAAGENAVTTTLLLRLQNDLFDLGADLAVPESGTRPRLTVTEAQVQALEAAIESHNANLAPLKSFVLPGGGAFAATAQLARAIVRRAERRVVSLAAAEPLNRSMTRYLNRLSDLLFVLAREANAKEGGETLWQPGGDRAGRQNPGQARTK